jgi:hypothetical protein
MKSSLPALSALAHAAPRALRVRPVHVLAQARGWEVFQVPGEKSMKKIHHAKEIAVEGEPFLSIVGRVFPQETGFRAIWEMPEKGSHGLLLLLWLALARELLERLPDNAAVKPLVKNALDSYHKLASPFLPS